nr:TPA: NADH dehydrogenase subunit 2 [Cirrodrilus suzukii]
MLSPMMIMSLFILILSTLSVIMSTNWPILWLMMELNMMMFIPFLNFKKMNIESEGSVKYFLCQSMGSALLIYSTISLNNNYYFYFFMMMALCMKLGSFPCYFWFISVMKASNWISCSMLMTWQKIAPLYVLVTMMDTYNSPMYQIALINMLVGGMFGMSQTDMRSLLAYSSVAHLGWMFMISFFMYKFYTLMYFILYLMLIAPMCMILMTMNPKSMNEAFNMNNMNPTTKFIFMVMILSLAGLPPMSGFMLKMIALYYVSYVEMNTAIVMCVISMMSLYMYLMMSLSSLFWFKSHMSQKSKLLSMKFLVMSMFMTPFMVIYYALTFLN